MSRRLSIVVALFGAATSALLSISAVGAGFVLGWPLPAIAAITSTGAALVCGFGGFAVGAATRPAAQEPPLSDVEVTDVDAPRPPPGPSPEVLRALESLAEQRWTTLERQIRDLPSTFGTSLSRVAAAWQKDHRAAGDRIQRLQSAQATDRGERRRLLDALKRLTAELAASAQARDAFLSRMSHELRTPLNAILGYAEMLEEDLDDEELCRDLKRIRSSAANLLGTITAVLDLTQLESGQYEVVPQPLDVAAMAREVGDAVQSDALANRNTLQVRAVPGTEATLDRRMLHSILFNLLSNACKYTHDGTVKLLVGEVEDRLRIVVADTGIGMTQRQIEAAMTPFNQGDASTTRRYDGSGLGLSVVHGFVEAMGGTLTIKSQPGEGAAVEVELPQACKARSATPAGAESSLEDQPTLLAR